MAACSFFSRPLVASRSRAAFRAIRSSSAWRLAASSRAPSSSAVCLTSLACSRSTARLFCAAAAAFSAAAAAAALPAAASAWQKTAREPQRAAVGLVLGPQRTTQGDTECDGCLAMMEMDGCACWISCVLVGGLATRGNERLRS